MSYRTQAALMLVFYTVAVTAVVWLWLAAATYAQPAPDAPPADVADGTSDTTGSGSLGGPESVSVEKPDRLLVVIGKGETAPYSGLLVTDTRFAQLKSAELRVDDAEFKAMQEKKTREDLQVVLTSCLEIEEEGDAWYETFWAGAVVGVGAAILVGWLGYKIIGDDGD